MLARRYDVTTFEQGKAACKAWLQARAGLPRPPGGPAASPRSAGSIPRRAGTCWPRSPTGCSNGTSSSSCWGPASRSYHELLEDLARRHGEKVWAYLGFSDDLAHQIEAGADVFLMPSLFEPCGLNQLYSLAHGTVPLVRATGGLADTVVDLDATDPGRRHGHGLRLPRADPDALWQAIERALMVWDDRRRLGPADPQRHARPTGRGTAAPGIMSGSTRKSSPRRREIPGQSARIVGGTAR